MTPVSALSQKDTDSKALVVSQLGEGIHLRRREPRARGGGRVTLPRSRDSVDFSVSVRVC
jgi:ribosomal protein L22